VRGPVGRYKRYADALLIALVGIAIWAHEAGFSDPKFGEPADTIIVAVGAVLSYEAIMFLIEWGARKSKTFLMIYWGQDYLDGLWYYTSSNDEGQSNLGVWRIKQDLFGTQLFAFRLGANFERLSTVASITDFDSSGGWYEVICKRTDFDFSRLEYFSRSRFVPDEPERHGIFVYSTTMRGETVLAGGEKSGLLSSNAVFVKLPDARSEHEMVAILQAMFRFDADSGQWKRLAAT
jgi:hypothetical protein